MRKAFASHPGFCTAKAFATRRCCGVSWRRCARPKSASAIWMPSLRPTTPGRRRCGGWCGSGTPDRGRLRRCPARLRSGFHGPNPRRDPERRLDIRGFARHDGVAVRPVRIAARVTTGGGKAIVDLRGCDRQVGRLHQLPSGCCALGRLLLLRLPDERDMAETTECR